MVLSVRSFYYMRDYIHFYIHYIHYIQLSWFSVADTAAVNVRWWQSSVPCYDVAGPSLHILRMRRLVSVVGLPSDRCNSSFLRLSIFLVTLTLLTISFDVWQKHGLSLVYNFRLIVLCMVSTIRSCDNVISIFGSIPRDLQVARTILHSSLFGQSDTKCSTVSVATPHSLHFSESTAFILHK